MWVNLSADELQTIKRALSTGPGEPDPVIATIDKALAPADPTDASYRASAAERYENFSDGDVDIDEDAVVSVGDGGAYVMAWLWVRDENVMFDEPEEECRACGAVEGTPEWGTVGDGYDGLCATCADKENSDAA
jgi:hypothetical protein